MTGSGRNRRSPRLSRSGFRDGTTRIIGLIAALVTGLLAFGAGAGELATGETARLNTWLNARYEEELQRSPIRLTQLGRKSRYDEIDDYSEAAELADYRLLEQSVAALQKNFDYEKLTLEGRISYDFWVYRLQIFRDSLPFMRHNYRFSSQGGAHSALPDVLISLHNVDTEQDMLDYIARIAGTARALRQSLERAQLAAKDGIRPPRFSYANVIDVAGKIITGAPFSEHPTGDSPLWADARSKISSLQERGIIDASAAGELRDKTAAALTGSLLPAYRELIAWLRADLPNTSALAMGASSLPDGDAWYGYSLAYYTTSDLDAAEIHALGLAEVARLRSEIESRMRKLAFEGSLEDFFEFIRTDPQFYFSNDDAGRQAYITRTRDYIRAMEARLPEYFGTLPRGRLVVKRVEPFMEQDGMSPYYIEGTADGERPGTYYLHLSDMSALNRVEIESTAYHEAVPGHHMQTSIALEQTALPSFRNDIWYSAYSEGWALYAEYLALEMGAYKATYSDVGRLASELMRAARLVVDTGLHARGWSEQRAVDYMLANTALTEVTIRSEVQRYLEDPGQATSYMVGMLKLLELRENARAALGERFDIRGFHDTVLDGGSLPLPILERRINSWIASQSPAARE